MQPFPSMPKAMRNSSPFSRMTSGAPTTVTVCLAEGSAVSPAAAAAPEAAIIAPIVNMEIIFIAFSP
jgi:uncharacterized membrane protein